MQKRLQKIIANSSDPKFIERVFEFAETAHHGQKRFSGEDYILHPLNVAQILSEMRLDAKTVAAGLLHDVPDDTKKTVEDIKEGFGKEIAFLVAGVSKLGKLRYPKKGLDVKSPESRIEKPIDLKAENLRKMFFAMGQDLRVILIKLADRLDNMKTLGALPPDKQQRIAMETLEIFAPLANRLGMGEMKGQLEDLAFSYLYPKEYEWLRNNIKERYEERHKHLEKAKPLLIEILKEAEIKPINVHSRPKHYWSLYQKLLRNSMDFDRIYDLIALRVIIDDVKTCYETLGVIHKSWRPLPGRIKDYIATPKPNGYQALHTTVICSCPRPEIIEIQVKTKRMHEEAEYGICAHWAVKENIDLKAQAKKFAWVQQLKDWQFKILGSKEFLEGLKVDFLQNRIFVFTPKGDVIDLPEGACPIDFAYAVHSYIGDRCSGAKVNGKMTQLSYRLKNGDLVEIVIDKNRGPSNDWLKFVKTNLARSRIKNFLKQRSAGEGLRAFIKEKIITLLPGLGRKPRRAKVPKIKIETIVSLAGQTGMQIHLAKCCSPRPGDKIKAYVTKNRGAAIHKVSCQDIKEVQKKWPQKITEATWSKKTNSMIL